MSNPFPVLIGNLTLVDLLLLLAPFVIVPLGLQLVPIGGPRARRVLKAARYLQPAGAMAALVSFLIPTGPLAGMVALGWLLACGVISLSGLIELIEQRSLRPRFLVPAAALAYLSVGAGWLVVSRAGIRPLGFAPAIVELTGVHFHYAGFAAALLGALVIVGVQDWSLPIRRLATAAGLLIVAGVPITAAGIATASGFLTVLGPTFLASGVLTIAGLTAFVIAPTREPAIARWFLWTSSAAVLLPMLLGVDYATGRVFPIPSLGLREMALIHGDLNAIGFSLAGLVGWSLARPRAARRSERRAATGS
jgi:hypothetical protein